MRPRPLGVRTSLLGAMTVVALASVGVSGLLIHAGVAKELAERNAPLSSPLQACIVRAVAEAGIVSACLALLIALPIALHLARPLRRLNEVAGRMARGSRSSMTAGVGGGREIAELGITLQRLAATLRDQDDLRRATNADVTHELRGAVGGMAGRIEGLQDGLVDPDAGLHGLASDARRLAAIVDDVQRLVEAQRPGLLVRTQEVDLAAVVRESVAAYAGRFSAAGVALELSLRPARVDGDAGRLGQVIENLLSNALWYTDPGGRVKVELRRRGRETVLEVSDTGIGIADEYLSRVFDRFWRVPEARMRVPEGSGVGLALVQDLVLAHRGHIEVSSRSGRGSRFRVCLPQDPWAAADATPSSEAVPASAETGGWALRGPARSVGAI